MKLLPLTLTLFDKVTNNTYKGTVLLKNLNSPAENASNATGAGLEGEPYDGKGAGLFIILVISVYALSIVLFIASFITKKSGVGESLNEESTVTTYLHKVGDLKEKTAREHFKKLKMSIISKVEADSQNQKRGRKGSKGAKELSSMSRTSSKSSLGEHKGERPKSGNSTEPIPSTGLLPKDDARQPLLGVDPEMPTPPVRDTLSPNFEAWGSHGRSASPSLRRATSNRTLSIIKEQDSELTEDSDGSRKGKLQNRGTLKRKAAKSVDSLRERTAEIHANEGTSEDESAIREMPDHALSDTDIATGSRHQTGLQPGQTSSLGRPQKTEQPHSPLRKFHQDPRPDPKIQRPRPKHTSPQQESYEDVWEQMPQKLMPPPKQKGKKNPKNLYVQIPQSALNSSDIWVLRNNNQPENFSEDRSPSPHNQLEQPRDERQVVQAAPNQNQTPVQRPSTLDTNKLHRSRSLKDRSQRDMSPPNQQHSMFLSPQENLNLPRPFRTPSPRLPTEQFLPRVPEPRPARDTCCSPGRLQAIPLQGAHDKDKSVVRITLDRSPDQPSPPAEDHGWSNKAYDRSPQPRPHKSERRERSPPQFTFSEGAQCLDVPRHQFPVTFNSPGLPRRKEETL